MDSGAENEQFMYLGLAKIPSGPLSISKKLSYLMYNLL
jgi:hypothetical protein